MDLTFQECKKFNVPRACDQSAIYAINYNSE